MAAPIEPLLNTPRFIRLGRSVIGNKHYIRKVDRKKMKTYFKVQAGLKEVDLSAKEVKELGSLF